ncbi:anhydro-N-acetylmuramic acid kinase [Candidatus Sororendozoicomonas aggregata]|uniref:anhydro-N-acetylmuramic acid kinase n=1 Tax=Candidatus Sororendozoicomonas aggregata TaxID=3073239 RepID=UPI002ED32A12
MEEKYIGLMSGTSLDAIDAVLVSFNKDSIRLLANHCAPINDKLRHSIIDLCSPSDNEIEQLALVDTEFAELSAKAVNELLFMSGEKPEGIRAIGSHGQTIRHLPDKGYTLQVGDPNLIAELTQITVVADFRRRDMAAGGQGAPLVPAFHQAVFSSTRESRAIVNIGGMSNISVLPDGSKKTVTGFDTGPGNVLLDYWCQKHKGVPFDRGGAWAASGSSHQQLLNSMMRESFFQASPPKSTGRELFNPDWLACQLEHFSDLSQADVQSTLCQLTVETIARAVREFAPHTRSLFVCGGGARNKALMAGLASALKGIPVSTSQVLGIEPEWVEAMAFAWLAKQRLFAEPGNLPAVTGAKGERVLGGVYQV